MPVPKLVTLMMQCLHSNALRVKPVNSKPSAKVSKMTATLCMNGCRDTWQIL